MKRTFLFPAFFIALIVVILLFVLGRFGLVSFLTNGVQVVTYPVTSLLRSIATPSNAELDSLKKQNTALSEQLIHMQALEADNKALRDQFQTTSPNPKNLLAANVVGLEGAVPNISFPENIILDKGIVDGVKQGMSVVVQDALVGTVSQVSSHFSKVLLVSSKESSLSIKDIKTGALGVAKGQGNGEILMDNVLLSDRLSASDNVVTLGTQTIAGKGVSPDMIIGKIVSVDKKAANIFQSAKIVPLISFDRLRIVFIVRE